MDTFHSVTVYNIANFEADSDCTVATADSGHVSQSARPLVRHPALDEFDAPVVVVAYILPWLLVVIHLTPKCPSPQP